MKKKSLWLITALMSLALIGVFVMQLYYIKESYKLNSQLFEQNVNQALNAVINKVQKQNAVTHINQKDFEFREDREKRIKSQTDSIIAYKVRYKEAESFRKFKQGQQIVNYLNFQDSVIRTLYYRPEMISEEMFRVYSNPNLDSKKNLNLEVYELRDPKTGAVVDRRIRPRLPKNGLELQNGKLPDTIRYLAFSITDGLPQFISLPSMDADLLTKFKVEDAKADRKYKMELSRLYADTANLWSSTNLSLVQDVANEMQNKDTPLEKRIPSKDILDTLIKKELLSKGITIDYNYWLTPAKDTQHIIYQNVANPVTTVLAKNVYSLIIFSNDVAIRDPGMLYVYFPKKNSLILDNMLVPIISSVGLLFVLIFIFAYTIFAIIKQKKLSEMKTDFINNMTHEFKTPVATIMIASEALKDPEVVADQSRINRLAGIIYDENVRLGNHIERVLSVARLEKKEIKLEHNAINVNDLITAVVDSMNLQLQKRNAKTTLNLDAVDDVIMGDELHLSNVIYNLIDNANKYSAEAPEILIHTRSTTKNLYIIVADKGIGMTKDQTKRIFDQFYRVPTGNLHDVKGFGLGLNYVQDIVNQMDGSIKVTSEKDSGTSFEITLPFKQTT